MRRAEAVVAWLKSQTDVAGRTFAAVGRDEVEPIARRGAKPDGCAQPPRRGEHPASIGSLRLG